MSHDFTHSEAEDRCGGAFTLEDAVLNKKVGPEALAFVYPYFGWPNEPHLRKDGAQPWCTLDTGLEGRGALEGAECIADVRGNEGMLRERVCTCLRCSQQHFRPS